MTFEISINGTPWIAGHVIILLLAALVLLALLYFIVNRIARKLRENETMKYEFITIIAHKFRTPLSANKWLIESMASEERDSRHIETLNEMKQANENLISLTGTLIEMTNLDSENRNAYNFEKVSLCDFVKAVTAADRPRFQKKNISFSTQCLDESVTVSMDRIRMEFVLQTILENACTYTQPGRKVEVSVGRDGHKAVVAVSDGGIGIDPSEIGMIFRKFFRAKNAEQFDTEGFGIGLYLAKSILNRHNGKIKVYSAGLNQGSTFIVELPIA